MKHQALLSLLIIHSSASAFVPCESGASDACNHLNKIGYGSRSCYQNPLHLCPNSKDSESLMSAAEECYKRKARMMIQEDCKLDENCESGVGPFSFVTRLWKTPFLNVRKNGPSSSS